MIDLQNKIAVIPDTKNGEPLGVPLSDKVVDFLERLPKSGATNYVFTYRGKRLKQVNTKCFQRAVLGAGIQDFRWHDLRHVWACWHVQDGTPLFALQEMAGWKSESMVRRYAHLSPEHLLQYTKATEVHI
jgi:integrase